MFSPCSCGFRQVFQLSPTIQSLVSLIGHSKMPIDVILLHNADVH